jgi:Icc protein
VTGLEPGQAYAYVALSNGRQAQQTSMQFPVGVGGSLDYPGVFTTLATPPGTYLFTLALSNDLHYGEGDSGIIEDNWPPSFQQTPGLPPYPQVMLQAMPGDLRQPDRKADRLLVAGDLTSNGLLAEAAGVKQLLDGWGQLERDYFVTRGNHDRSRTGTAYDSCTVVPTATDHHDCRGDVFPYRLQQLQTYEVGGLRIVGLDTTALDNAGGTMDAAQIEALTHALSRDRDRPTLLFGHHPITYESAATTEAGPSFDIDRPTAIALQRLYERTPGVFFHHSGHTHRNKRTFLLDNGQSPVEPVEFSLYPHYMLGTIADRNHTVTRDLSGLTPPG